jgi:hypothetical protein
MYLTAKAKFRIVRGRDNAGPGLFQRGENLIGIISDRGNNADPGNDDAAHMRILPLNTFHALRAVLQTQP